MDASFVPCAKCGAEVSDDRETCPHCGTAVVTKVATLTRAAADDIGKEMVARVVKLDQQNGELQKQVAYLLRENSRLESENTELRKKIPSAPPTEPEKEKKQEVTP